MKHPAHIVFETAWERGEPFFVIINYNISPLPAEPMTAPGAPPHIVLNLEPNNGGNNYSSMSVTNDGFSCMLSFDRRPHTVEVKWPALMLLHSQIFIVQFPISNDPLPKPKLSLVKP